MSKYFERQLEELHVQLITLGSYCEKAISLSAKAISAVQNEEMARQVFDTDRDIDAKEREIEILMLDRCTKSDAEKHLKNGSTVFEGDDFEKFFDDYMKEWNIEEEDIEEYRKMITDKIPVRDWGIVEDNGETYYIMYVL